MKKSKCPVCGSNHTKKNGKRSSVQTYKCCDCSYQFRNTRFPSGDELWRMYQSNKQMVSELAVMYGVSELTIKRRLRCISHIWEQPPHYGNGYVHLDATYWGHNWGVMLGLDEESGQPLYVRLTNNAQKNAACNLTYRSTLCSKQPVI